MSKKLILCFDGTGNDPKDAVQKNELLGLGGPEDDSISNVLKLHLLFGGDLQGKNEFSDQMSFYYSGVGTYGTLMDKLRNMALAPPDEDVGSIIKRAIQDLYKNYDDGDKVFVFGFSRGAAIARRFSTVLADTFPALGRVAPKIDFIGVFDTVAALKRPNLTKEEVKPASDVVFENKTISPLIKKALHLLSLDERRIAFMPTLMNMDVDNKDRVTEVWFSGAHSDVGGGYRYDGLSDLALQFMLDFIHENDVGLKIKPAAEIHYDDLFDGPEELIEYNDVIVQPNYLGKCHQQHAITRIKEKFLHHREPRVSINDKPSIYAPVIHHSVFDRMYDHADYDPTSLRTNMVNPYTGKSVAIKVWRKQDDIVEYESLADAKLAAVHTPIKLEPNESRSFIVHSNQKYNGTRVLAHKGERYVFSVKPDQIWFDAGIQCGPSGWDRNNESVAFLMKFPIWMAEGKRRYPDADWFEVIGAVNRSDEHLFRLLNHCDNMNPYEVTVSGEIYAFANDLMSKYGNNMGSIEVTIKRII